MTITTKLEGLLPANGPETKTDRIIADAVEELRAAWNDIDTLADAQEDEKLANHNLRAIITQQGVELRFFKDRLEWDDACGEWADGIACRDETIQLQDERVVVLKAAVRNWRFATYAWLWVAVIALASLVAGWVW